MHGMPVAFLLGLVENANKLPGFGWYDAPYVKPEDIVYIGLRDLDSEEKKVIKKLGIKSFTMHDIDKYGIGTVMDQVCPRSTTLYLICVYLDCFSSCLIYHAYNILLMQTVDHLKGHDGIHLSYDIDAIDPFFAPHTGRLQDSDAFIFRTIEIFHVRMVVY
jgi:arginase